MNGILPIIKNNSGCDYHRIINPMVNMGFDMSSLPKRSTDEILKETKILLFNRTPGNTVEEVLKQKNKFGFKIIQDLDDYWELNVTHPMYKTWNDNNMGKDIVKWLHHADAVTVTTARLADKVRLYNKNVHVIPNALPFDEGQFTSFRTESTFTRFIYTGGDSHLWDINVLRTPMSKLQNVPNAKFILTGPHNPKIWSKMENVMTAGGKLKSFERRETRPLNSYMKVYEDADVSIIPLEHNIFTPFKSNIKFLEAGCKNMPVICSDTPPYSDEPVYLDGIRYAKNTKDWLHWFKYYHSNPNSLKENGLELGEYVREHYSLYKMNIYRKQLFENLIS